MTTYTIIWQDQGEYIWHEDRRGNETSGYIRDPLTIEYFNDEEHEGKAREVALQRFAELQHTGDVKETLELLVNGKDYWDTEQYHDIEQGLQPLLEAALEAKKQRIAAEQEAKAQAALEEARRIATQARRRDEAQFEELRQKLGR